jgi:hypothetical protein
MADRYWVGGTGLWDSSSTTNWSATSGGASGASAPTSVDDVFFNASSGSPTVITTGGAVCRSLSHAAGNATFNGPIAIHGNLTFSAGTTLTSLGLYFYATSGSWTINTAGRDLNGAFLAIGPSSASTATWTLGAALTNIGSLSFYSGTFSTSASNYGITGTSSINYVSGYATTVNFNGSTIGSAASPFNVVQFYVSATALLTLNLGTSTIYGLNTGVADFTGAAPPTQYLTVTSSAGQSWNGGTAVYSSKNFYASGGSNISLKAITNFRTVTFESKTGTIAATAITLNGDAFNDNTTFEVTTNNLGTISIASISVTSSTYAEVNLYRGTFTCSGAITLPDSSTSRFYEDNNNTAVTVSGALTTNVLTLNGGAGVASFSTISVPSGTNVSPWTFSRIGNLTTGNIVANNIITIGLGNVTMGTMTSIGATQAVLNHQAGNFSSTSFLVGGGAGRWAITAATISSNFSTGAVAAYGPNIQSNSGTLTLGAVTLASDAYGTESTLTLGYTGTVTSLTATTGSLTVNSGAVTFSGAINIGGSAVVNGGSLILSTSLTAAALGVFAATINFASATVSLTNQMSVDPSATVVSTAPSITFNPSASTLFDFYHGGKTYTGATITANGLQLRFISSIGSLTFTCANFTRTGTASVYSYLQLLDTNITCTGTVTLTGNSLTNRTFVYGTAGISTITASTRSLTNVDLRNITGAGGSLPWGAGTSVGDVGNNTNITFTPAVIRYARGSGAWDSTTVWSATAGGATGATVPLAQDDVQFTSASGAVNVTTGTRRFLCRNLAISNFTGTITVNTLTASTNEIRYNQVLGDLSLDSSATIASSDNSGLLFTKVGTASIVTLSNITAQLALAPTIGATLNMGALQLTKVYPLSGNLALTCNNGTIKSFTNSFDGTLNDTNYYPTIGVSPTVDLSAVTTLNTSYINIISPVTGTSTVNVVLDTAYAFYDVIGTFYNLVVINTVDASNFGYGPEIYFFATITNSLTTTPSTIGMLFYGSITCNGNGRFTPGTFTVPIRIGQAGSSFNNFTLTNNTSFPQETQYAYYANSTVIGSNPQLRAFGATNVRGNTVITFPTPLKVAAFTNFTGSWQVPNDFGGTYQIFTVGGGGGAAVQSSGSVRGSGGGGSGGIGVTYALNNVGVQRKSTVYVSAANATGKRTVSGSGISGGNSWLNVASNTIPSNSSVGASGYGGNPSSNFSTLGGTMGGGVGLLTTTASASSGGSSSSTTTSAGGGGGAPINFSYGNIPNFFTTSVFGGSSTVAGRGGGGGAGVSGSAGNGLATGGGVGGAPNGGLGGTNSPALDGGNGTLGGGGGGGGITKSGGDGSSITNWTYNYLNGVTASGTIGVGGGGGGTGYQSGATRVIGGDGGIGAGGGGVGYYSSGTNPYGGSGGAGLVLFVYAVGIEDTSAQFIG